MIKDTEFSKWCAQCWYFKFMCVETSMREFEFGEVTATVEFSCASGAFYALVKKVPAFSIQTRITQLVVLQWWMLWTGKHCKVFADQYHDVKLLVSAEAGVRKPKSRRPEAPVRCWRDQRIAQYDAGAMTSLAP